MTERDHSTTYLLVIFIVGLLWVFMHPAPSGGPVEHKCWFETGYESC